MDVAQPFVEAYGRNGLAGPWSIIVRPTYTPRFARVEGSYAPLMFDLAACAPLMDAARPLPITILTGGGCSVDALILTSDMPFATKNVVADQIHFVVSGTGVLETDFGILDVNAGDVVLVPGSTMWRYRRVAGLEIMIVSWSARLLLDPQNAPGTLDMQQDVDAPRPYGDMPPVTAGEYELVVQHESGTTSFFYDGDPLPSLQAMGDPAVRRFNADAIQLLSVPRGRIFPTRLMADDAMKLMLFAIGQRRIEPNGIHHNADYGELTLFVKGPGSWGPHATPGTISWLPRGLVHHGPSEDQPLPWRGFFLEIAVELTLTSAGHAVARLMDPTDYAVHQHAPAYSANKHLSTGAEQ
jgi:homogentisate 1,2-dioxygenase